MEFEVLPTDDNLDRSILTDCVERNKYLFEFYNMLNSDANIGVKTVALDGNWGSGKTFFVKSTMLLMNEKSKRKLSEKIENLLKNSADEQARNLKKQMTELPDCNVCPFYYDAWIHDSDQYPTLSILNALCEDKNCLPNTVGVKDIISSLPDVLRPILGEVSFISSFYKIRDAISKVIDNLQENKYNDLLSSVKNIKNTQILMKELLGKVVEELNCEKLVIFIDELDRCNPLYAVKLLEEIKHYYSSEKVLFVFSVNLIQLKNAVNSVYGEKFESFKYLDRFFDIRLTLPEANSETFLDNMISHKANETLHNTILSVIDNYGLELRESYKYIRVVAFLVDDNLQSNIIEKTKEGIHYSYYFVYYIVLPIAVGLKFYKQDLYVNFISGKNSSPLIDLIRDENSERVKKLISIFERNDAKNLQLRFEEGYQCLFNKNEIAYRSDIWSEMLSVDLKSKLISKVLMLQN